MRHSRKPVALALVLAVACGPAPATRSGGGTGAPQPAAPPASSSPELEQLVAPIALYPDALVAQILMASTYPLEVVEAARWARAHPGTSGEALESALQAMSWDASVKSLTAFPQVLEMMDQKLDWTTKLGDAFLAQQAAVLDAVQVLRARAQSAGSLESNAQQTVTVESQPVGSQPQTIVIQPASPEIVYVPTYDPSVVYGAWPYPAYPPYFYYPPGYVAGRLVTFGVGLAVGAALWGGCNWGGGDVNININRYNEFNRTSIDRSRWTHDSSHRKGVQYRDQAVRERYGKGQPSAPSREPYRGRADQGRQDVARGDADRFQGAAGERPSGGRRDVAGAGEVREAPRGGGRDRGGATGRQGSAFSGAGHGAETRRQAERGHASQGRASSWGDSRGGSRGGSSYQGGSRPSRGGGGGGGGMRRGGGRGRR